jgi:hypothetical protein
MTFARASEPFQEPPRRQPHGPWMIGTAVLFLFFVPLLVITAEQHPASTPTATPSASAPLPQSPLVPPLPPPGAPWPPPPGAPQPPPCVLGYRLGPDGGTTWTAMTTLAGELTVRAGSGQGGPEQRLAEPEGVHPVTLTPALLRSGTPRATLTGTGAAGQAFDCVVGQQSQQRPPGQHPGPPGQPPGPR